jgi:hypothetical protein
MRQIKSETYREFTRKYYDIPMPIDMSTARSVYNIAWGLTYNTV